MRFFVFTLHFGLLLFALVTLFHVQGTNANCVAEEVCRKGNCMSPEKCEILPTSSMKCSNPKETCCSLVKPEFRTLCQHYGGECMDECNKNLIKKSTDCRSPQKCCVLV